MLRIAAPARPRQTGACLSTWLLVLACLLPGVGLKPADAASADASPPVQGTLHVCIDARGLREYRDTACTDQQRSVRALQFERAPADPAALARRDDIERTMERRNQSALDRSARNAAAHASARAARAPAKTADACRFARERRESEREHAVTGMPFERIRQLDREVWMRCRNG